MFRDVWQFWYSDLTDDDKKHLGLSNLINLYSESK